MGGNVKFDQAAARHRSNQAATLKRNRALIGRWHDEVRRLARERKLLNIDVVGSQVLTNFPSATLRFVVWAGGDRIASDIGCGRAAVVRMLARLRKSGLLTSKRRGMGRTSFHTLCLDGRPLSVGVEGCPPVGTKPQSDDSQTSNHDDSRGSNRRPSDDSQTSHESYEFLDSREHESKSRLTEALAHSLGSKKRTRERSSFDLQAAHNVIAQRLGSGDIEQGWLRLMALDGYDRAALERAYRDNALSDQVVAQYAAVAALKIAGTSI